VFECVCGWHEDYVDVFVVTLFCFTPFMHTSMSVGTKEVTKKSSAREK
jgi:hypothetical protein